MTATIALEVLLIFLLVLANGVFALSEMAVVSARRARLRQQANAGDARARAALELAEQPDRFLPAVQIGITLVGVLAGAFGGATIAEQIAAAVNSSPAFAGYGEAVGLGAVVIAITFLSLVFGELVPKRLALNSPETFAKIAARPMSLLSRFAAPVVWLLGFSTRAVLKILRVRQSVEPPITEDELKILLAQGTQAGVFAESEQAMVERIFRLDDLRVGAIMTPRVDVVWLDAAADDREIAAQMEQTHVSRLPVCRGAIDNVVGTVKAREYLADKLRNPAATLDAHVRPALFVPETVTALEMLEKFKDAPTHLAIIVDEHGAFEGVVTTNDVLEAIAGNLNSAARPAEPLAVRRADGSWLFDGALPLNDFRKTFNLPVSGEFEKGNFQTLAGFALHIFGRIPQTADNFVWNNLRFEIVDMDGRRIDKILVENLLEK